MAGVDGAAGRWVIATVEGSHVSLSVRARARDVLAATSACAAVGVDVPLFVPETGVRESESLVRAFLGSARSSLFPTPVREAVYADSWEEACVRSRKRTGKAISKQSWYLTAYVREWAEAAADPDRVVEVHPESSFRALAPDALFTSKKRARGVAQRMTALSAFVDLPQLVDEIAALEDGPAMDDALDAVAAAWSARRWVTGEATLFGERPDLIVV